MAVLFFGGVLIFPLSMLVLKLLGWPASLPSGHPAAFLAMQTALTVPLGLLVVAALGITVPELFFPASLVIVGAHYLPFITLYGMRVYAAVAVVLVLAGVVPVIWWTALRDISGWIGAAALLLLSIPIYLSYRRAAAVEATE